MQATEKDPNFLNAHLAVATTYVRAASGYARPREAMAHAVAAIAKAAAIESEQHRACAWRGRTAG